MSDYIDWEEVVKARIDHDGVCWNLYGIDGRGGFTEDCARFATWGEAMAWMPLFLAGMA